MENFCFIRRIHSELQIVCDDWSNSKTGYFIDEDNNCMYRFKECPNGSWVGFTEVDKDLPVLACGFVAWLIKHWGTDTQIIYLGYLQAKLNQYKVEHKNDADVFMRDLEREFYSQHRTKEEQLVKQSEAIFDFISEPEVNQIKKYVQYYFEYVNSLSNPHTIDKYTKETEIFSNYLHHTNKEALMKKLHELVNHKQAKDIAITIQALINLSMLANYGSKANLYRVMRIEFTINCTNSGINDFLNKSNRLILKTDTEPIEKILSGIK